MNDITVNYFLQKIIPIVNWSLDECQNSLSKLFLQIRITPNDHDIFVDQTVSYLRLLIQKIYKLNRTLQEEEKHIRQNYDEIFYRMSEYEIDPNFKDPRPLSRICNILYRCYWMIFNEENELEDIVILIKEVELQKNYFIFDLFDDL